MTVEGDFKASMRRFANWPYRCNIASTKCCWFNCLLRWSVQNQVFYLTEIFKKFYFGGWVHFQNGKFRWSWALAASTMISHFHRYRLSIAHTVAAAAAVAAVNGGDGVH